MHTRGANQSEIYFNQSLRNCKYFQHISLVPGPLSLPLALPLPLSLPLPETDSLAMRCDPKATTKAMVNGVKIIANAGRAGERGRQEGGERAGEQGAGPEFVSIYFTLELMRCCRLTFCKCSGCSNRILVAEA